MVLIGLSGWLKHCGWAQHSEGTIVRIAATTKGNSGALFSADQDVDPAPGANT
jgi:hypothetical protein